MHTASDIEATLLAMADASRAEQIMRFFKTNPGQYGEGDRFIGLTNPRVRAFVREVKNSTPLSELSALVKSPWHEARLCALLIMVELYLKAMRKGDRSAMEEIFKAYIEAHPYINNWDLVDLSAIKIVGNHEALNPEVTLLHEWINPQGHSLWQQRIAMVSTWMLIRKDRADVCFRRAEALLSSPHDLLHKAAGWMLREAWKKGYTQEVRAFLEKNVGCMPAIMLSYTCEKMTAEERHDWQQKRKQRKATG